MSDLAALRRIDKTFKDKRVLHEVSLTVPEGCVVGIVGENGAGKTTLMRILLGLAQADAGEVELFGEPFSLNAPDGQAKSVKNRLGVVFDTCPFPEDATVAEIGSLMKLAYTEWSAADFDAWCAAFCLEKSTKVKGLSRGMGMKLQLAVALSHNAQLLVLDEATAGLDPVARAEVLGYLGEYMKAEDSAQERGILLCSHITTDLERIADVVVGLHQGEVLFSCDKDAITDIAGVAHCPLDRVEHVLASYGVPNCRVLREEYAASIMVPNRRDFSRAFPDLSCERLSIDAFLQFQLKGECYE